VVPLQESAKGAANTLSDETALTEKVSAKGIAQPKVTKKPAVAATAKVPPPRRLMGATSDGGSKMWVFGGEGTPSRLADAIAG